LGVFHVKKSVLAGAAASVAFALAAASAAQAGTVFDTSLVNPPGVFFGTGNFNTHYAVTTDDGVEIGLKSKIRGDATDSIVPVGDVYSIGLGNKVSFDFSVNPNVGGSLVDLSDATALLTIVNEGTGQSFSFDPSAIGDDTRAAGGYQNSEQLAFFPVGFTTTSNFTYDVTLSLSNVGANHDAFSTTNIIKVGNGDAVPEPMTWALMLVGFGGIGATLRRARKSAAAATA
jgi:hypothetical protein